MSTSSENFRLPHRRHAGEAARPGMLAGAAMLASVAPGVAQDSLQARKVEIGFVEIDSDITLRRMVVRNSHSKGTVLFLHGFPETLYAWKDISLALADDHEVHAFDWPGYGLSSRPSVDRFAYAPSDYARVLDRYITKAGLDSTKLTIYATDIGALPALLLALEKPDIAKTIIVGDFAPFNRPQYMYASLQALKTGPLMDHVRVQLNKNRDEILANTFTRGLPEQARFELPQEFRNDISHGWSHGALTTADAFARYYAHFTRDQNFFESELRRLKTPVKVVWGEKDLYIDKEMGAEFADKINVELRLLPGIGHYPTFKTQSRPSRRFARRCDEPPLPWAANTLVTGARTMNITSNSAGIDRRRLFVGGAAIAAAAQFGIVSSALAQAGTATSNAIKAGTHTTFGPLKHVNAGLLDVAYAEVGPADGPPVILLHGWPYDIHSFVDVAPALASAGHRVLVPYLRGYGATRFLASETLRNGQPSALAVDLIAFMDALKIEKAVLAGFDWGARSADIAAALWPERVKALVAVSGYLIGSQEAGKMPLPPKAEFEWWYQFYFATERGRLGYEKNRNAFNKLIWQLASPKWNFDDATFGRSAAAFDNPDHVDIVVHNYRWRLGLAEGEAKYADFEKRLAEFPVITVPTITLESDANGAPHPDPKAYAQKFSGKYQHRTVTGGIGHNLPQEDPKAFVEAVLDVARA